MQWVKNVMHPRKRDQDYDFTDIWSGDQRQYSYGQLSYAALRSGTDKEDRSQVEIAPKLTYVGIYTGHGGRWALDVVFNHLFPRIVDQGIQNRGMFHTQQLRDPIVNMENEVMKFVRMIPNNVDRDKASEAGASCIAFLLWGKEVILCNLGDSRAVMGRKVKVGPFRSNIIAQQLTQEDNVNIQQVREKFQTEHRGEVVLQDAHGIWKIRGLSEVSGCIGGLFLKYPEFQTNRTRLHGGGAIDRALLKTVPNVQTFVLTDDDLFMVLGSRGFWDHLSNEEVVKMVEKNKESEGMIAKILIAEARIVATRKMEQKMATSVEAGELEGNLIVHDDMSVVVLFFKQDLDSASVSLKAFAPGGPTRSRFDEILPHIRGVNVYTARGEPSDEASFPGDSWAELLKA